MWYGLCADLVVAIHLAYVGFVIFGQLFIIVGAGLKWQWVRNPWFRYLHLLAIAIVAIETLNGWQCPLTTWEAQLRELGGQGFNGSSSFIGKLLHDILFVENVPQLALDTAYIATMLLVLQGLIMYPPRWFRTGKSVEGAANTNYQPGMMATA